MQIFENHPLDKLNTFGLPAKARRLVAIDSEETLKSLIPLLPQTDKILCWGGGSNILLTQDVDAWVLKNELKGRTVWKEDENHIWLRIGAGEGWHETVMYAVEKGWGGIENLSLIPGSVGAAPIQNIGAYGVELKDVFDHLEGYELRTGEKRTYTHAQCNFGYRDSIFKREVRDFFITEVCLRLSKKPVLHTDYGDIRQELTKLPHTQYSIQDVSNAVIAIRSSKLPNPAEIGNAGSFFKNPTISTEQFSLLQATYPDMPHYPQGEKVKIPAAWLIQQCGWKGKRLGNYGVHERQALVLVNYGGARGSDLYQLSCDIQQSVAERFGIGLEREVNVV